MSDVLDLLLKTDVTKIARPTKNIEIKRLSQLAGEKVIFSCQGLTSEETTYVAQSTQNNTDNTLAFYVVEGVKNPDFKNKELLNKYGVLTPVELVNKLLLPGEISKIYEIVSELSGFAENSIEEIKNE